MKAAAIANANATIAAAEQAQGALADATQAAAPVAAAAPVVAAAAAKAQAERGAVPARGAQIWAWLGEVADPEIPVISIVDLGIVRDVQVADDGACDVTITPTYSGCPAMQVIADAIIEALHAHGIQTIRLHNQISPAWTTDWMSDAGKAALKGYGIAPPAQQVIGISGLRIGAASAAGAASVAGVAGAASAADAAGTASAASAASAAGAAGTASAGGVVDARAAISRRARPALTVACPNCGSRHTEVTSQFGSTPCKALYKCLDCREPFDYFKCH